MFLFGTSHQDRVVSPPNPAPPLVNLGENVPMATVPFEHLHEMRRTCQMHQQLQGSVKVTTLDGFFGSLLAIIQICARLCPSGPHSAEMHGFSASTGALFSTNCKSRNEKRTGVYPARILKFCHQNTHII